MLRGLFLIASIFCFSSLLLANDKNQKKIFVIESYHAEYAWDKSYREGLQESISNTVELTYFQMDTKRLPKDEHAKMADKAWSTYEKLNPNLVILGDDAALRLLGERFAATTTPTVYLGINNNPRNYFKNMPDNITGILERPLLIENISYVQKLVKSSKKRCLVLFDGDITSQIVKTESFANKTNINLGGLDVDIELVNDFETWKKLVLTSKDKYDFLISGLYQTIKDSQGKVMNAEDVIKWTSDNAPIPPFGFWDFSVGKDKAIGGIVLSGKDMGLEAGKMAQEILNGKDIKTIKPIFKNQGVYLFSKAQLEKWKLAIPEKPKTTPQLID